MDLPDPLELLVWMVSVEMDLMDDPEPPDTGAILVGTDHPVLEERGETTVHLVNLPPA